MTRLAVILCAVLAALLGGRISPAATAARTVIPDLGGTAAALLGRATPHAGSSGRMQGGDAVIPPAVRRPYDDVGVTDSSAWSTTPGGNFSRPESITYPSGHLLEIGYDAPSSGTSSDHFVSRVRSLTFDGSGREVLYEFLGLATPVIVDYQGPDVQLDRTFSHDGGRQWGGTYTDNPGRYPGFDAFGRLVRHAWLDGDLAKGTGSGAGYPTMPPLVELVRGYNLASFITER